VSSSRFYNLRVLKTVLPVLLMLILAIAATAAPRPNQQPQPEAPTGPLSVWGYVYDLAGQKLVGATVVVKIVETDATRTDTTDSEGRYQTPSDFSTSEYDLGYTIQVTAAYNSLPQQNSTQVTQDIFDFGVAQVDVHYTYEIPEFGSVVGTSLAGVIIAGIAVMVLCRRRLGGRVSR